jgi:hypothetical protein
MTLIASDFNLQRLDTKQLFEHIKASIEAESNIAFFGQRGIGKTSIARQATAASDHLLVSMNVSMQERPDVGGYPNVLNSPDHFVHHLFPLKYKPLLEGDRKCVLFLDELDKADASLNAPLLELIEDHALDGTHFPNLVSVISTGNLIGEGGTRPIPPLLDRTEKYFVEATVEAWLEWAGTSEAKIHPAVRAFIQDHPDMLMDVLDHPTYYATRSPRGWHKVSRMCWFGERFDWKIDLIIQKAAGFVGSQAGMQFALYFSHYKRLLPLADLILAEGDFIGAFHDLAPNEKLYVAMIVSSRLTSYLDANVADQAKEPTKRSKACKQMLKATGEFFTKLYDAHPEYVMLCLRNQIGGRVIGWSLDEQPEWNGVVPAVNDNAK